MITRTVCASFTALLAVLAGLIVHRSPADAGEDEDEGRVEIEVVGRLRPSVAANKFIVYAQTRPCSLATLATTTPIGIDTLDADSADKVFAFEAEFDEDDQTYVCALGLNAEGHVIAYGGYESSPVLFHRARGEEYGRAHGLDVPLRRVDPPLSHGSALLAHYGT
jgi:hypothetical protein